MLLARHHWVNHNSLLSENMPDQYLLPSAQQRRQLSVFVTQTNLWSLHLGLQGGSSAELVWRKGGSWRRPFPFKIKWVGVEISLFSLFWYKITLIYKSVLLGKLWGQTATQFPARRRRYSWKDEFTFQSSSDVTASPEKADGWVKWSSMSGPYCHPL